jgi:hypothetical protein
VIERDFSTRMFYYEQNTPPMPTRVHYDGRRAIKIFNVSDKEFPLASILDELPGDCRDDANNGGRWDIKWLRPLNGASISDALMQTQDPKFNGRFNLKCERFRINSITGTEGDRIVDISIIYMPKDPEVLDGRILHIYRLKLAEEHDFLPLAIHHLSSTNLIDDPARILDGDIESVLLFEKISNVDGIPIPFDVKSFAVGRSPQVEYAVYHAESVKLNEHATVRERLDIPTGSFVSDDINGVAYRQGGSMAGSPIDKTAADALKEIRNKEVEELAKDAKSRADQARARAMRQEFAYQPFGSVTSAIWIGVSIGFLVLVAVLARRK